MDRLYDETQITVELVPDSGWSEIQMKSHKDIIISAMPEIKETLTILECCYVLRDGMPLPEPEISTDEMLAEGEERMTDPSLVQVETHTIRGTNNLPWLSEYWNLSIEWMEGKSMEDFRINDGQAPCLVRRELLEETGLTLGDSVTVSPTPYYDMIHNLSPEIPLTIIGTYAESFDRTEELDLLVPEEGFLNEPKLLYSGDMMYRCYYRAYAMKMDPAYNREYDRVEDALEKILYDMGSFSFATNARAIENAARPLIQKLQIQEMLVLPLSVLLLAAAVVAAVLLGLSFDTEVFLRLLWGEKRGVVFIRLGGAVCLWLLICMAASCMGACLTAGGNWVGWAVRYSGITAVCGLSGCAVPLGRACSCNLVRSYQSKEGE